MQAVSGELSSSSHDVFGLNGDMVSMPDQFQCFTEVMGEASIKNGMEEMWSETKPQLHFYIDNWKKCTNAGNEIDIARYVHRIHPFTQ